MPCGASGRRGRAVLVPGRLASSTRVAVWAIRRLLRDVAFDLVHAHYGLAGWCAWLAGARPLIVTFHGTDVRHPVVGSAVAPAGAAARPDRRRLAGAVRARVGACRAARASPGRAPSCPAGPTSTASRPDPATRRSPAPRARSRGPVPAVSGLALAAREAPRPGRPSSPGSPTPSSCPAAGSRPTGWWTGSTPRTRS